MPGTAQGWARLINSEWRRLQHFFSHTAARKTDMPFCFVRCSLVPLSHFSSGRFLLFGVILETFWLAFCPLSPLAKCQHPPPNSNVQDTANLLWISRESFHGATWEILRDAWPERWKRFRKQVTPTYPLSSPRVPRLWKGTKGRIARRLLISNWAN